jgi:hypothetical protein
VVRALMNSRARPHQIDPRAVQLAERAGFRDGEQVQRRVGRARLDLRLGGGHRPAGRFPEWSGWGLEDLGGARVQRRPFSS